MPGEESEIEIRPFYEAEDFGAEYTPELRAKEEKMRADIERQQRQWRRALRLDCQPRAVPAC